MPQIFANNATSTLSAALTNVAATLFIQPGHGGRFPVIAGGDFMYCALEDAGGNLEIVKVTAHAAAAQSFTIERAQQGTAARAWAIGDLVELRFTAAEATAWEADIDALQASRALKAGDNYSGTHNFIGARVRVGAPDGVDDVVPRGYADALSFASALPAQAGNDGKVIRTQAGNAAWDDWWGAPTVLTVADNGAVLAVRKTYHLDSSGGPFSVSMPVMAAKDWIKLVDVGGQLQVNPVTVVRNVANGNLAGFAEDRVLDMSWDSVEMVKTAAYGVIEQ